MIPRNPRAGFDVLRIGVLMSLLVIPLATMLLAPDTRNAAQRKEFRRAARAPTRPTDTASLVAFPAAFDAWFDDHFAYRSALIAAHNRLCVEFFETSPTDRVLLGKHGWMFVTTDRDVDVYRGVAPLDPVQLGLWEEAFVDRAAWLAERDIESLAVFVPSKAELYPEHLPDEVTRVGPTRMDQLRARLAVHADVVPLLDLAPALRREKTGRFTGLPLYRALDSHWNVRGAYVAYCEILAALAPRFPELVPHPARDYDFALRPRRGDDWATRMYVEDLFGEDHVAAKPRFEPRARPVTTRRNTEDLEIFEIDDERLPRAVVFHDSFGAALRPFLAEHFSYVEFHLLTEFDRTAVRRADADVVIQLMNERGLLLARPATSPFDTHKRLSQEFAASTSELLAVTPETGGIAVSMAAEVVDDPTGGVIRVETHDAFARVELPAFEVPAGMLAVIEFDVTFPTVVELELEFTTSTEPTYARYARTRSTVRRVPAGRSTFYVKLRVPDLRGPIRIKPAMHPVHFEIHGVRVRGVPHGLGP